MTFDPKTPCLPGQFVQDPAFCGAPADANAVQIVHSGSGSRPTAPVGICASPGPSGAFEGAFSAPTDLAGFVATRPAREVASALALSRGTAHRLKAGYWPADARKILAAWARYRGRAAVGASSWFLRRVRDGGIVPHGGRSYTAPQLAERVGEMLALIRTADGGLLAQTLDLPVERMPLEPVSGGAR